MPKFGELLAADVWTPATRTLTDFSAEEIFDLPAMTGKYPSASASSGAGVGTFGVWSEVLADVGSGKRLIGLTMAYNAAVSVYWLLEIGEGGSGSEAAITEVASPANVFSGAGFVQGVFVPLWKSLTDNARLAIRIKDTNGSARNYQMGFMYA